jgi:hypothetical protein
LQLTDYSNLRSQDNQPVVIPLNGEYYRATPVCPAATLLESISQLSQASELAGELAQVMEVGNDPEKMAELAAANPALMLRLSTIGMSSTERAIKFLNDVLYPEDAARWMANMRPPDPGWPVEDQEAHMRRMITMPQVQSVYRDLQAFYSGRPTGPSSSSPATPNGTGGTSTDGAQAATSTPST